MCFPQLPLLYLKTLLWCEKEDQWLPLHLSSTVTDLRFRVIIAHRRRHHRINNARTTWSTCFGRRLACWVNTKPSSSQIASLYRQLTRKKNVDWRGQKKYWKYITDSREIHVERSHLIGGSNVAHPRSSFIATKSVSKDCLIFSFNAIQLAYKLLAFSQPLCIKCETRPIQK